MPILDQWKIKVNVDDVLQAQGANPSDIRKRKPNLITITEDAISLGKHLIKPTVLYQNYEVKRFIHNRIELVSIHDKRDDCILSGGLISKHLANAKQVSVVLCTIGNEIDDMVSSLFHINPLSAIALDGFGSAAVEQLAIYASNYFERSSNNQGLGSSMPLNPGMDGWPIEDGQLQIFSLIESEEINVTLTDSLMMMPSKSLSMVIGIGENLSNTGSTCEFCSLKGVCKYQNHYAKKQ